MIVDAAAIAADAATGGGAGGGQDGGALDWFAAAVLGLVEGITEFLPVSSTGHLIVAQRLLGLGEGAVANAFSIGIQMGAITAILVLYWRQLLVSLRQLPRRVPGEANLLLQIVIAALPAAVLGLAIDDWIDAHLFSTWVVACSLLLGGVLLLLLERWLQGRAAPSDVLSGMRYRTALCIGLWQCLALIPGTSRSGATIAGALLLGLSRTAGAEFSFLVGLPILYGAALYKLLSHPELLSGDMVQPFWIGTGVAFLSALLVVRPFVAFLRQHTFRVFGWYRIVAGAVLLLLLASGWLS